MKATLIIQKAVIGLYAAAFFIKDEKKRSKYMRIVKALAAFADEISSPETQSNEQTKDPDGL